MTTATSPADFSRTSTPRNIRTSARPSEEPSSAAPSLEIATPQLPPPETFDFLAPLHELLSRLLASENPAAATISSISNGVANASQEHQQQEAPEQEQNSINSSSTEQQQQQSQSEQHQQHPQTAPSSSNLLAADAFSNNYPNQQPLSIQHLAAEMSTVHSRIRNARRMVEALPDVDRSIEEQEEEMKDLNLKISELKRVLERLGEGNGAIDMPVG